MINLAWMILPSFNLKSVNIRVIKGDVRSQALSAVHDEEWTSLVPQGTWEITIPSGKHTLLWNIIILNGKTHDVYGHF